MKLQYDREADALIITLRETAIRESDELGPGLIADYAESGDIVRLEILGASTRIDDIEHIDLATHP
ncbi:MAG: DUF2283 domain-containing protein [Thermomicrobiales bacterium]